MDVSQANGRTQIVTVTTRAKMPDDNAVAPDRFIVVQQLFRVR